MPEVIGSVETRFSAPTSVQLGELVASFVSGSELGLDDDAQRVLVEQLEARRPAHLFEASADLIEIWTEAAAIFDDEGRMRSAPIIRDHNE